MVQGFLTRKDILVTQVITYFGDGLWEKPLAHLPHNLLTSRGYDLTAQSSAVTCLSVTCVVYEKEGYIANETTAVCLYVVN